tara:strand:+ start:142 stop:309 length:168 start_codon:yes stop_codon:yes gene_type:complete
MLTEKDLLKQFILQYEDESPEIPLDDPDDAELSGEAGDDDEDEDDEDEDDWAQEK